MQLNIFTFKFMSDICLWTYYFDMLVSYTAFNQGIYYLIEHEHQTL